MRHFLSSFVHIFFLRRNELTFYSVYLERVKVMKINARRPSWPGRRLRCAKKPKRPTKRCFYSLVNWHAQREGEILAIILMIIKLYPSWGTEETDIYIYIYIYINKATSKGSNYKSDI